MIVKHKHSQHHHIIMHMSHSRYGGLSLPDLWKALSQAYNCATLDTPSQFSNFTLEQNCQTTSEAYTYWRYFLSGSSMTAIAHRQKPAYKKEYDRPNDKIRPPPPLLLLPIPRLYLRNPPQSHLGCRPSSTFRIHRHRLRHLHLRPQPARRQGRELRRAVLKPHPCAGKPRQRQSAHGA
jgi:hypothetical protein